MFRCKHFFTTLFVCCVLGNAAGQTRVYAVQVLGKYVGDLSITREISGNTIRYSMQSDAEVDYWFGKTVASYRSAVLVQQGRVRSVTARTIRDDETERFTLLRETNGACEAETKNGKEVLDECPSYCVAMMFFEPPTGLSRIFSEDFGRMVDVYPDGHQVYVVRLPDGKKNRYRYNNGGMVELISGSALGKAVIRLK